MQLTRNKTESYWRMAALACALVAAIYIGVVQTAGVDFWLQAKIGEIIVKQHEIPSTLLFPFGEIASEKFNAHEWLASIVFYQVLALVGESGLPFFTCLLSLSYFAWCARLAYRRGNGNMAFALIGGAFALATENYRHVLRPELLSLNLMVLYWISLERFRQKPSIKNGLLSAIWVVLWVNCHGSFILAPILAALYTIGMHADAMREQKKLMIRPAPDATAFGLLTLGMFLTCLVNPFGWDMVRFVFDFSGKAVFSNVVYEWMPSFEFTELPGLWIGVAVWGVTLAILLLHWRKASYVDICIFVAFSLLAYKAIRFPVYLGMVLAFIFPAYFDANLKTSKNQIRLYQGFLVCVLGILGTVLVYGNANGIQPYSLGIHKLSQPMVKQLENPEMKGNVLTSMPMGAELIYRAYPRLRPSIDCRVDSYGVDYVGYQDALFFDDKLLNEFVNRYDVKYMLIDRMRFKHFSNLEAWKSKHWGIMAFDNTAVLLKRTDQDPADASVKP